jgi:uncharacterized phage-like protein YoqJ
VKNLLLKEIENAYNMGFRYFYCGMAMGFDLLAAEAAISLKSKLKELKLIAVIPHPDQTRFWDEKDKELYNKVLKKANRRILLSDSYSRDSLLKRNDYLLVNSSLLIAFYNGNKRGGTYYTYRRALRKGMDVINLYDRVET